MDGRTSERVGKEGGSEGAREGASVSSITVYAHVLTVSTCIDCHIVYSSRSSPLGFMFMRDE